MKHVISTVSQSAVSNRRTIAGVLLIGIAFAGTLYAYFLLRLVYEASHSRETAARMMPLSSQVNDLEALYLSLKSSITEERAASLGFSEARDVLFVSRKSLGATLSFNRDL